MLMREKTVLVTGAAAGIGESIARLFAEEGARVWLLDRDENRLRGVVDDLVKGGAVASMCVADLRRADQAGVVDQWRTDEHGARDLGLVVGERHYDMARRVDRACQRFGERATHQRRGIVERRRHRHQRFGANRFGERRNQIGARERANGFGARGGRLLAHPGKCAPHHSGIDRGRRKRGGGEGVHLGALSQKGYISWGNFARLG